MSSSDAFELGNAAVKAIGVGLAKNRFVMKIYEGKRSNDKTEVIVNGNMLNPRFDIWPYDFNGFEWGYECSGALQLSLALLADHYDNDQLAHRHCQTFAHNIVVNLPFGGWKLSSAQIEDALSLSVAGK